MGVYLPGLGLLALARATGADFSSVVTLGRQGLHINPDELVRFFKERGRSDLAKAAICAPAPARYCEELLRVAFGAGSIDSIDASTYECATIIHDMNRPLIQHKSYALVVDFGTLEHVFNVAVALDNVAALCAPGGRILHALPADNQAGHGFYQFAPELFFEVYAPERGFAQTRIFLARSGDRRRWYEVGAPRVMGRRVEITSNDRVNVLVMTTKEGEPEALTRAPIQQSDYRAAWSAPSAHGPEAARSASAAAIQAWVRRMFAAQRDAQKVRRLGLTRDRPDIIARRVMDLTSPF
jgi:SAM-dependent methyltransferase